MHTIRRNVLATLPDYRKPPTYRIDDTLGAACFLDPPGFPTYYLQHVWTQYGNTPRYGSPHFVIMGKALPHDLELIKQDGRPNRLFTRLYAPLPYEHPRVQAWEMDLYLHFQHCYKDVDGIEKEQYGRPATLIYPVPSYKLHTSRIDPRWKDEIIAAVQDEDRRINADMLEKYAVACRTERHMAVLTVRKIYPDAPIRYDYIENPPKSRIKGWERSATD